MSPKRALFLACIMIPLTGLGIDLYTPSLPAIAHSFDVSKAMSKLTVSAYLYGFAIGQFMFGIFTDVIGRKKPLLFGLLLYFACSVGAVFNHNIYGFFALRLFQGIGGASISLIGKLLLSDTVQGEQLAIAATYLTTVWGIGPIVAPVIGGYLQYYFDWQAAFWGYALYSSSLLVLMLIMLKETLFTPIEHTFAKIVEHHKRVFSNGGFVGNVLLLGLGYSMMIFFNIIGPFLIQSTLHYSPIVFGHVALMVGGGFFVGSVINRVLLKFKPSDHLIRVGLATILVSAIVLLFSAYEVKLSIPSIVIPILILVIGVGILFPNCMAKTMAYFPEKAGIALGIMGGSFLTITAIMSSLVSLLKPGTLVPVAWVYISVVAVMLIVFEFMVVERTA